MGDTWATILGASGAAAGAAAAFFMYFADRGARGAARRTKAIEDLVHAGLEPLTLRDKEVAAKLAALAAGIAQISQDLAAIRERQEKVFDRTTVLETKMEVFWKNVALDVAKVLHSPNPAREHLDGLLDDLVAGRLRAGAQRDELRRVLRYIRDYHHGDPSDFPIYPGDQVAAAILLHTMDLLAGGTAVDDGEAAASLILAAEKVVEPLRKAVDRYKWAVRTGAAVLVLLVAALIVLALVAVGQRSQDRQLAAENAALKTSAVALCQTGNTFRQGERSIWDKLFIISYAAQKPTPENRKLGEEFLAYVAQVDALHNCKALVK